MFNGKDKWLEACYPPQNHPLWRSYVATSGEVSSSYLYISTVIATASSSLLVIRFSTSCKSSPSPSSCKSSPSFATIFSTIFTVSESDSSPSANLVWVVPLLGCPDHFLTFHCHQVAGNPHLIFDTSYFHGISLNS